MVKANYKNRRANSKLRLKENHIKRGNLCLRLKSSDIKVDEVGHSFPPIIIYIFPLMFRYLTQKRLCLILLLLFRSAHFLKGCAKTKINIHRGREQITWPNLGCFFTPSFSSVQLIFNG